MAVIPFGAGGGIASGGGGLRGHDGAVVVAEEVVGRALAAARVEFQRHVTLENLLAPEGSQGLVCLVDHVGPAWRALEAVDDLPVAAVGKPCERRFIEVFIDDIAACHLASCKMFQ